MSMELRETTAGPGRVAVVDIGSNAVRLVVYDETGSHPPPALPNGERLRNERYTDKARLAHILSGDIPGLLPTTRLVPEDGTLALELAHDGAVNTSETVERRLHNLAEAAGTAESVSL